jgi:site-specific recombinase XerC
LQYPPDPRQDKGARSTVEEIVAAMRCAGETVSGLRAQALIVLLWRAGLQISEALALSESDLNAARGAVLVRRGKRIELPDLGPPVEATRFPIALPYVHPEECRAP